MNFISFDDLNKCIYKNLDKIPQNIDLVVGIPRSGSLVANLIALYLNLPYTDIYSFVKKRELVSGSTRKSRLWIQNVEDAKHVLVVDDSISSGKAMREAKDKIERSDIKAEIIYMAVYALRASSFLVDIYFELCEQPRMFEWNYMHHWMLEYTCMDIDGVLCRDPTIVQRLGEKNYQHFLSNATPYIIPTQKVGILVTGRNEKYRDDTEEWLRKHNVIFDELKMMPNDSNVEHYELKAQIYLESKAILFIESNYEQSVEICRIANKPVFCVERKELIDTTNVLKHLQIGMLEKKITIKRVIRKLAKKIDYVK